MACQYGRYLIGLLETRTRETGMKCDHCDWSFGTGLKGLCVLGWFSGLVESV
jgi:hypothetical protein